MRQFLKPKIRRCGVASVLLLTCLLQYLFHIVQPAGDPEHLKRPHTVVCSCGFGVHSQIGVGLVDGWNEPV